jgi:hypothetical protein
MNEQQCKDLYRQVVDARVKLAANHPLEDAEMMVLESALHLETALILLLATKPNYSTGKFI